MTIASPIRESKRNEVGTSERGREREGEREGRRRDLSISLPFGEAIREDLGGLSRGCYTREAIPRGHPLLHTLLGCSTTPPDRREGCGCISTVGSPYRYLP